MQIGKVDPIIIERFLGHKNGNPQDGISRLMMTYDPEDWAEMQAEFEGAIPHLTITEAAIVQTKLEEAENKLKNVPTIEDLQKQIRSMQTNFELLIRTGTLDPVIDNNSNITTTATNNNDNNNSITLMNEIILERTRELKESKRKQIKEDIDQIPEVMLPYLESKREEARSKSK